MESAKIVVRRLTLNMFDVGLVMRKEKGNRILYNPYGARAVRNEELHQREYEIH